MKWKQEACPCMDNGDAFADLVNTGSAFSSCGLPFVYMVHAETKFVLSSVKRSRSPQVNLITEVMASEITAQQPRRKKKVAGEFSGLCSSVSILFTV